MRCGCDLCGSDKVDMRDKGTGKPKRVLVVSSELDVLDEHCRQLRAAGWRVMPVTEEIDALTAVRHRSIDVVVLHWPLEDLVDMDFVDVLRHIYPGACLPVMVLVKIPQKMVAKLARNSPSASIWTKR